jgi:hypothetical protein
MEVAFTSSVSSDPADIEIVRPKPWQCLQMLVSPIQTLASLKDKPGHFMALLIAAFYATAMSSWIVQRIGIRNILASTIQATGSVDAETMLANTLRYRTQILWTQAVSTFIGTFITAYLVGLLLWLIITIAGKDVQLKAIHSVVAHSVLFYTAIKYTMFGLSVLFSRNPAGINIKNPLATNVAFYVHGATPVLQQMARSLDVLVLAAAVLIIIGLRFITPRLSALTASLLVLVPWSLYIVSMGLLGSPS